MSRITSRHRAAAALVLSSVAALTVGTAKADYYSEVQNQLNAFNANPQAFMNGPIFKRTSDGKPVNNFVSEQAKRTRSFVGLKKWWQQAHLGFKPVKHTPGKEDIGADYVDSQGFLVTDRPENVVDALVVTSLEQAEAQRLTQKAMPRHPWSDDYWGIYAGTLGSRYNDPNYRVTENYGENFKYLDQVFKQPVNASNVDALSPAEKYDLLVGDPNKTLTRYMIDLGKQYMKPDGSVETWMGICHGWSPASYNVPRPTKTVSVTVVRDGAPVTIHFFPADIKALSTVLWSSALGGRQTKFIGGRCNDADPATDPNNGRILDKKCRDNNPATFHLALVNQIGVAAQKIVGADGKVPQNVPMRGLTMDATYDYEVWNQPILSYGYSYFNPQSMKNAANLVGATAAVGFAGDKFAASRSPNAVKIVGIAMNIQYIAETQPTALPTDSPNRDRVVNVRYLYDLEIDAAGKIVGGEWYQNAHPDFLWTNVEGQTPSSVADRFLTGNWNGTGEIPDAWKAAIPRASSGGQPAAKIVTTLQVLGQAGI